MLLICPRFDELLDDRWWSLLAIRTSSDQVYNMQNAHNRTASLQCCTTFHQQVLALIARQIPRPHLFMGIPILVSRSECGSFTWIHCDRCDESCFTVINRSFKLKAVLLRCESASFPFFRRDFCTQLLSRLSHSSANVSNQHAVALLRFHTPLRRKIIYIVTTVRVLSSCYSVPTY